MIWRMSVGESKEAISTMKYVLIDKSEQHSKKMMYELYLHK